MGRRDRSGSVNDTGNSAAGAGWPAALTLARQREATFKKRCRLHRLIFSGEIMRTRAKQRRGVATRVRCGDRSRDGIELGSVPSTAALFRLLHVGDMSDEDDEDRPWLQAIYDTDDEGSPDDEDFPPLLDTDDDESGSEAEGIQREELNDGQQRVFDHIVTAVQSNEECMLINTLYANRLQNMVEFIALPLLDTDDDENDDAEGAEGADSTAMHVHVLCDEAPMCHLSGADVTENVDSDDSDDEVPVLDTDSTDYNYVEVQSRGSLHMHMIIFK